MNNNELKVEWCYLAQHSLADWIGHAVFNPSSVVIVIVINIPGRVYLHLEKEVRQQQQK